MLRLGVPTSLNEEGLVFVKLITVFEKVTFLKFKTWVCHTTLLLKFKSHLIFTTVKIKYFLFKNIGKYWVSMINQEEICIFTLKYTKTENTDIFTLFYTKNP